MLHIAQHISILVALVYKSPPVNVHLLVTALSDVLHINYGHNCTVLLGDFNVNLLVDTNNHLQLFMVEHHFQQVVVQPTTEYGSLFDHIYINAPQSLMYCYVCDILFRIMTLCFVV